MSIKWKIVVSEITETGEKDSYGSDRVSVTEIYSQIVSNGINIGELARLVNETDTEAAQIKKDLLE